MFREPSGQFVERMCKLSLEPLFIMSGKSVPAPTHDLQALRAHIPSRGEGHSVGDCPTNISNGSSPSARGRPYSGPCQACFRLLQNQHRPSPTKQTTPLLGRITFMSPLSKSKELVNPYDACAAAAEASTPYLEGSKKAHPLITFGIPHGSPIRQ